jgi:hypothetical protein
VLGHPRGRRGQRLKSPLCPGPGQVKRAEGKGWCGIRNRGSAEARRRQGRLGHSVAWPRPPFRHRANVRRAARFTCTARAAIRAATPLGSAWMPVWIAIALQATPLGGTPPFGPTPSQGSPDQATLSVLPPRCDPSAIAGEIVVCGRTGSHTSQRLQKLDSRFERSNLDDEGRFSRRLSDQAAIGGGGPKGSVGLTLRIGF